MRPIRDLARKIFYQHFPSGHVSAFIRTIYLKRNLRGLSFRQVLDAGCGEGEFTLFLAKRNPEAQFTAYDINEESVAKGRRAVAERGLSNVRFKKMDLKEVTDRETYDLVYTLECLEHIPGNRVVLDNLVNALRPGGSLYIMMPCEKIHKYLFPRRWFEEYNQWAAAEHIGDQYTLEELTAILEGLGVEIVRARYTFGFWGKLAWELHMLTQKSPHLGRPLLPALFAMGCLDVLWPFSRRHPAGLYVLGKKHPRSAGGQVAWMAGRGAYP